jgi:hypothetical protein
MIFEYNYTLLFIAFMCRKIENVTWK